MVRLPSDAWLVSSALHLLPVTPKSNTLKNGLGWSSPPRAAVVVAQLLKMGALYGSREDGQTSTQITILTLSRAAEAIDAIYSFLGGVLDSPESDLVRMSLEREGISCVWVEPASDGADTPWMVPSDLVALSSPVDHRPWLFTVPTELLRHQR